MHDLILEAIKQELRDRQHGILNDVIDKYRALGQPDREIAMAMLGVLLLSSIQLAKRVGAKRETLEDMLAQGWTVLPTPGRG